jgi:maleate isomerase
MIELIERTAKVPAVAVSPAVVAALRLFNAKKISVATPYPDWNNGKLQKYLKAQGFTVLNVEGDPKGAGAGNQGINDLEPDSVVEFASKICKPEADVLFCSCTAWRAVEAVDELERLTGKPVVTSNQATIWAALRKVGIKDRIRGFGELFDN